MFNSAPDSDPSEPFGGALHFPASEGAYFFIPDMIVLSQPSDEVLFHEVAHRMVAEFDQDQSALRSLRDLRSLAYLLLGLLVNTLSSAPKGTRLLRKPNGTFVVEDPHLSQGPHLKSLLQRWYTIQTLTASTERWITLVCEAATIDIVRRVECAWDAVPAVKETEQNRLFASVVRGLEPQFSDIPAFKSRALAVWQELCALPESELRVELLRLSLTFADTHITVGVNDPLTTLRHYLEMARTYGSRATTYLQTERATRAALAKVAIAKVAQEVYPLLPTAWQDGETPIDTAHMFRHEQASIDETLLAWYRDRVPPGFGASLQIGPTSADTLPLVPTPPASWLGRVPPFIIVQPQQNEMVATLNPLELMLIHISRPRVDADWWRDLLFMESLHWSLVDGRPLACPLANYRVWSPTVSDLSELARATNTPPVIPGLSVECGGNCKIRGLLEQMRTCSNLVAESGATCREHNIPTKEERRWTELQTHLRDTNTEATAER